LVTSVAGMRSANTEVMASVSLAARWRVAY
jgi:hypothetical protein